MFALITRRSRGPKSISRNQTYWRISVKCEVYNDFIIKHFYFFINFLIISFDSIFFSSLSVSFFKKYFTISGFISGVLLILLLKCNCSSNVFFISSNLCNFSNMAGEFIPFAIAAVILSIWISLSFICSLICFISSSICNS